MPRREICVVTGSRADYGLLFWLMKEIEADPDLALRLVVTGAHLDEKFGGTVDGIERDGFTIDARVPMDLGDDTQSGIARAMGAELAPMTAAFEALDPHIVVLQGDRYEILIAAVAAMLAGRPVAHTHGGESTLGAMDDAMRHAITKMSHLHFTAAEDYRRRIIQMGEAPERVFTTGALGLDGIERLDLLSREDLEHSLRHDLGDKYFLVTYHPATLGQGDGLAGTGELLAALDRFPEYRVVITGVNADPGHGSIRRRLAQYADDNRDRVFAHQNLGQLRYLSAMKHCAAVIGNSSSGLIEAPALAVPTVNLGDRQGDRLSAPSVIPSAERRDEIAAAVEKALSPQFADAMANGESPYGGPGAAARIRDILKRHPLEGILKKRFFDLKAAS